MKLYGSLFTEIINICLICGQPTIMDCIMNFIALGAIAQIDDYYAQALTYCPLKAAIEIPLEFQNSSKDINYGSRKSKSLRVIYRL